MKYRFPKHGELTVYGYNRDLTEYVTEKQLLDENLWKLFVNQYRIHSDKNGDWRGEYWGKTMRGGCLIYVGAFVLRSCGDCKRDDFRAGEKRQIVDVSDRNRV